MRPFTSGTPQKSVGLGYNLWWIRLMFCPREQCILSLSMFVFNSTHDYLFLNERNINLDMGGGIICEWCYHWNTKAETCLLLTSYPPSFPDKLSAKHLTIQYYIFLCETFQDTIRILTIFPKSTIKKKRFILQFGTYLRDFAYIIHKWKGEKLTIINSMNHNSQKI